MPPVSSPPSLISRTTKFVSPGLLPNVSVLPPAGVSPVSPSDGTLLHALGLEVESGLLAGFELQWLVHCSGISCLCRSDTSSHPGGRAQWQVYQATATSQHRSLAFALHLVTSCTPRRRIKQRLKRKRDGAARAEVRCSVPRLIQPRKGQACGKKGPTHTSR
jgi:hypothetical protein